MGWNDRLAEDPYEQSDEQRQEYLDWQEFQHYLAAIEDAALEPPAPASPCTDRPAIDIFGLVGFPTAETPCNAPEKKEPKSPGSGCSQRSGKT
jgi:hypothetical protein